jgi:hypothetical protein
MSYTASTIDEYLHKRLMPVEGVIPHLPGIEMYGDAIPAGTASEQDKLFVLGYERRIKRSRRNVVEAVADRLQRNPKQQLHHLLLLVARG